MALSENGRTVATAMAALAVVEHLRLLGQPIGEASPGGTRTESVADLVEQLPTHLQLRYHAHIRSGMGTDRFRNFTGWLWLVDEPVYRGSELESLIHRLMAAHAG